jgi:hypothetical protein
VRNIANQLKTQNQYHFMFFTCTICLCRLYLSYIAVQFFRKIIFWRIVYCHYFEFHKNHLWKHYPSYRDCRKNKLISNESSNTFLITDFLRISILYIIDTYRFHTIDFLRNFGKHSKKRRKKYLSNGLSYKIFNNIFGNEIAFEL